MHNDVWWYWMVFVGIGIALNDTHVGTLAGTGCANRKILVRPMTAGAQVIDAYFPTYSVPHGTSYAFQACVPAATKYSPSVANILTYFLALYLTNILTFYLAFSDIISGILPNWYSFSGVLSGCRAIMRPISIKKHDPGMPIDSPWTSNQIHTSHTQTCISQYIHPALFFLIYWWFACCIVETNIYIYVCPRSPEQVHAHLRKHVLNRCACLKSSLHAADYIAHLVKYRNLLRLWLKVGNCWQLAMPAKHNL